MKLTKSVLFKLITEMMEHGGISCGEAHPVHTHHEWEEHKKEEDKKTKAMAKITIITEDMFEEETVSKNELRAILRRWEEKEYEDDEARWRQYAADIEELLVDPLHLPKVTAASHDRMKRIARDMEPLDET